MAKRVNAGALRTKIRVVERVRAVNENGVPVRQPVPVYAGHCHWVNAHGSQVYELERAGVTEPATLTLRYTPKITPTCEIFRGSDPRPYEVVSLDDVENRHVWLEVRVKRKVEAT